MDCYLSRYAARLLLLLLLLYGLSAAVPQYVLAEEPLFEEAMPVSLIDDQAQSAITNESAYSDANASSTEANDSGDSSEFTNEDELPEDIFPESRIQVSSEAHVQNDGWLPEETAYEGECIEMGTTGKGQRLEAICVDICGVDDIGGSILYQVHVQDFGWMGYVGCDEFAGTTGQSKRIEAVKVILTGPLSDFYDVFYSAHVANIGWMGWASDGEAAGTAGYGLQMESLRLGLFKKGSFIPDIATRSFLSDNAASASFLVTIDDEIYQSFITVDNEAYLYLPSRIGEGPFAIISDINCTVRNSKATPSRLLSLGEGHHVLEDEQGVLIAYLTVSISDINEVSIFLSGVTIEQINSGSKDSKYYHNVAIINGENTHVIDADLEIKGRGNTTWSFEKKPYQIKLSKKANLFDMGKAKTWVLLANCLDPSLLRNAIASELGVNAGLDFNPEGRFVDLWVDGRYIGNYYLMEKVQINIERVNLTDIYGVLVEIDNAWYPSESYSYYSDLLDAHYVLKDSVAESQDRFDMVQVAFDAFRQKMDLFESLITNPDPDWNEIGQIADLSSLAKNYLIQEFCGDIDSSYSSIYVYTDSLDDKLHFGPLWDFDRAFGNVDLSRDASNPNFDLIGNAIYKDWTNLETCSVYRLWNILYEQNTFMPIIHSVYAEVQRAFDGLAKSLDNWGVTLAESIQANFSRYRFIRYAIYPGDQSAETSAYVDEFAYLYSWVESRIGFFEKRFNSAFVLSGHCQDIGWIGVNCSSDYIGTVGESKRLEAVEIAINSNYRMREDDSVIYQVHVSNVGWMDWVGDGTQAGTTGIGQQIEAIRITISGAIAEVYDVYYRLHIADYGWLDWAKNGEKAGSEGLAKRAEALQILLVEKNLLAPGSTNRPFIGVQKYTSHVSNIGWQEPVYDGDVAGTVGLGLAMEAIVINKPSTDVRGGIEYTVYVANKGWQDTVSDGAIAGTTGEGLAIEAIMIDLTGELRENYSILYCVHIANKEWQEWVADGQMAGTTGESLAIEAIKIKLVEKEAVSVAA